MVSKLSTHTNTHTRMHTNTHSHIPYQKLIRDKNQNERVERVRRSSEMVGWEASESPSEKLAFEESLAKVWG